MVRQPSMAHNTDYHGLQIKIYNVDGYQKEQFNPDTGQTNDTSNYWILSLKSKGQETIFQCSPANIYQHKTPQHMYLNHEKNSSLVTVALFFCGS